MARGRLGRCALALSIIFGLAAPAWAAPQINAVAPHGLQTGATTKLTFNGNDLAAQPQLLFPVPIEKQVVLPESNDKRAVIEVTLAANVPAGIYPVRLVNQHGISPPVRVAIDALPQAASGAEPLQLPVAVAGQVSGGNSFRTKFQGAAGQRVVIEVEAARLGSSLNPLLRLYDPQELQLAWAQASRALGGDARIELKLPADGVYEVSLHDALYKGNAQSFFRLKLGELNYADFTLPLAVHQGERAALELVGSTIAPPVALEFTAPNQGAGAQADWSPLALATGTRPWVFVSQAAEVREDEAADVQTVPAVPLGISGRLAQPREEDVYQFPVTPGAKLRFEVVAHRLGSSLDAVLSVRNADGGQLAQNDDAGAIVDPQLDFTVPAGVEQLRVAVSDLTRRGGHEFVYHLRVTPLDRPSFSVTLNADAYTVPQGGATLVRVTATRANYAGPVQLQLGPLPAGVTLSPETLPAGVDRALVSLVAESGATGHGLAAGQAAAEDPAAVPGSVMLAGPNASLTREPWQANQFVVAVVPSGPLSVAVEGLAGDAPLKAGEPLACTVKLTRGAAGDGPVRLSLVTNQVVPQTKVKKDGKDQMVDDVEKALRLADAPTIAPEASELAVKLLVPADLPASVYDLAIQAEQLSADGKQVRSTVITPVVRRTSVAAPAAP